MPMSWALVSEATRTMDNCKHTAHPFADSPTIPTLIGVEAILLRDIDLSFKKALPLEELAPCISLEW